MASRNSRSCLTLLRKSGSTNRVLNLPVVKERHGQSGDYHERPLFAHRRLNEAIVLKHTLRSHERDRVSTTRRSATKIVFPFSSDDLSLGGQSLFVEEDTFDRALLEQIGRQDVDEDVARDRAILSELARLPSLDPYLLRERVNQMQVDVAKLYFDISDADVQRMHAHVMQEIQSLVSLAFKQAGPAAEALAERMAKIMLSDENSDQLEPLRQVLRMSKPQYAEAMFAWKGFLYYKWQGKQIQAQLNPTASEILQCRIKDARPDEMKILDGQRQRIVGTLGGRAAEVKKALCEYDRAYDSLVEHQDPTLFRKFLAAAPGLFLNTGEHVGALTHICSFWRFRFKENDIKVLEIDEANDLFSEFESGLCTAAQTQRAA